MKNLSSAAYWHRFGELGANIGKAWMPSPKEAADTVTSLMAERDRLEQEVAHLRWKLRITHDRVRDFSMRVANEADELRHANEDEANGTHAIAS